MKQNNQQSTIGLRDAISIGIGGMVGGGIFAVLGLAVSLSKGATPLAFLIAGVIALVTSYSYSRLSLIYPDRGGTVKFINQQFGKGIFSGGLNNLLWISYIVMLALYASAFGSYAPNLLSITGDGVLDPHIYSTGIIVLATLINYYSIKVVGEIESIAVIVKLIILMGFVAICSYGLIGNPNLEQLQFSSWESPLSIITGGMVIFVAYEGFELIANAASDIEQPRKNIPKAYFYSVGFVVVLYIAISIVTLGSLPFSQIASAEDYVLAEAAKPMLGQYGFTIITIAALLSTFSAINASLYGGSRVNFEIAEEDELPHEFTSQFWNKPVGLLVTSLCTIIAVNLLQLESISTAGSLGFLLIFGMVNYVGYRQSDKTKGNKIIPIIGFTLCILASLVLTWQQMQSNSEGILVSFGIIIVCFVMELIYKRSESYSQKKHTL